MTESEQQLQDLAAAVRSRRRLLGLTQEEVSERGGPSDTTLTKIESGTGSIPADATLRKLDEALRWKAGSAKRVLEGGGEPTPLVVRFTRPSQLAPRHRRPSDDTIEAQIDALAARASDQTGGKIPHGWVAVPLADLIEIALDSVEVEDATGLSTYISYEDLDEYEYTSLVDDVEVLEREASSLTSSINDLITTHIFENDPLAFRRLRKLIENVNNRRVKDGGRPWRDRYGSDSPRFVQSSILDELDELDELNDGDDSTP